MILNTLHEFMFFCRSYSGEDIPRIDSILRSRERETFINKPLLEDVPVSPLAKGRPRLYKEVCI